MTPGDEKQLRAEVESLRAELAGIREGTGPARPTRRRLSWRTTASVVMLALVLVLSPLCVVASWADAEIADTDRYVSTVAPLATDPAIQDALTRRIAGIIDDRIDVEEITTRAIDALADRGLPTRASSGLRALAVPLDGAVERFISERVSSFVRSETFADAWVTANRQAHVQLVAALTGDTSSTNGQLEVTGRTVSVNLAAVIDAVRQDLIDAGFNVAERIPTVNASFVLFESADVAKAQRGFRLLDAVSTVLPVVTIILAVGAVWLARSRRSGVAAVGGVVALSMVLLGLILAVLRPLYLDALPEDVSSAAAAAVFDALVAPMRTLLRLVLVIAVLVGLAAWATGPQDSAVTLRRSADDLVRRLRAQRRAEPGPVGQALGANRTVARLLIAVLAVVMVVFADPLTGATVLAILAVAAFLWLVVELVAAPTAPTAPT